MTPSTWMSTRIGALATVSRGASPRPIASPRWFDDNGDVRWVRIADVNRSDGRILYTTTQALSDDGIARSRFLEPGTLIMSIAATVGVPVITGEPACIHDGFVALENLKVDKKFLLYLLKASEPRLLEAGQSGSQMNINSDIVRGLKVRVPSSIDEQALIGSALWDVDDAIASLERLRAKKRAVKQGMMQELLTGRTRLPGFDGEWQTTMLGSVLKFQPGAPFSSEYFSPVPGGLRLVRNRDLRADDTIMYYSGPYSTDFVLSNGDVLIGMDGEFEPVVWRGGPALLNQRVGRLCLVGESDLRFIAYALTGPLSELQHATGVTTVKHLSHRDVELIEIPLPTSDEQHAIASALADADAEIAALERRLESARAIKQGMMQELLTGRTRLPIKEDGE